MDLAQIVRLILILILLPAVLLVSCSPTQPFVAEDCITIDEYTIQGPLDFAVGYPAPVSYTHLTLPTN